MKKKLSVICFAFLGLMNVSSVLADNDTNRFRDLESVGKGSYDEAQMLINGKSKNKNANNGIMNDEFVRNIKNRKDEDAKDDALRAQKKEKENNIFAP